MTTSKMQNVSAVADDGISGTYYNINYIQEGIE